MKNKINTITNIVKHKPIYVVVMMITLCLILMPSSGVKGEAESGDNIANETELPKVSEPEELDESGAEVIPKENKEESKEEGKLENDEDINKNNSVKKPVGKAAPVTKTHYFTDINYDYYIRLNNHDGTPAINQKVVVDHMVYKAYKYDNNTITPEITKTRSETLTTDSSGRVRIRDVSNLGINYQFTDTFHNHIFEVSKFPLVKSASLPGGYGGLSTRNGNNQYTGNDQQYVYRSYTHASPGYMPGYRNLSDDTVMLKNENIYNNILTPEDGSMKFSSAYLNPNNFLPMEAGNTINPGPQWTSEEDIPYPYPGTNKISTQRIMRLPASYGRQHVRETPTSGVEAWNIVSESAIDYDLSGNYIPAGELNFFYKKINKPDMVTSLTPSNSVIESGGETNWTLKAKHGTNRITLKNLSLKEVLPFGMVRVAGSTKINGLPVADSVWGGASFGDLVYGDELIVTFKTSSTGNLGNQQKLSVELDVFNNLFDYNLTNDVTIADADHNVTGNASYGDLSMNVVPKAFHFKQFAFSSAYDTTTTLDKTKYLDETKVDGLKLRLRDSRNTGYGWNLNAKLSQFESTTIPGYYLQNTTLSLKGSLVKIVNPDTASEYENASAFDRPYVNLNNITIGGNGLTKRIISAYYGEGRDSWQTSFPLDDIKLTIPKGQGIAGMQYQSTLTWTLEDAP